MVSLLCDQRVVSTTLIIFSILSMTNVQAILKGPENRTVDASSNATFHCQADPSADLCWSHSSIINADSLEIVAKPNIINPQFASRVYVSYDNATNTSSLVIINVECRDEGFYKCCKCRERQWLAGRLTVRGCEKQCVCVGDSKTLPCYDSSREGPDWWHCPPEGECSIIYSYTGVTNDQKQKFSVSPNEGHHNLVVLSAQPGIEGTYKCVTNNSLGFEAAKYELCIQVDCLDTSHGAHSGTISLNGCPPLPWSTLLFTAAVALRIANTARLKMN
jgi:hypothetical protein